MLMKKAMLCEIVRNTINIKSCENQVIRKSEYNTLETTKGRKLFTLLFSCVKFYLHDNYFLHGIKPDSQYNARARVASQALG